MKRVAMFLIVMLLALPFAFAAPADKVRVFLEVKGPVDLAGGKVLHTFDLLDDVIVVEVSENALTGILRNPNVI
ncbi:hypothetical protein KY359_06255, partial [Candidatus Woesearchaeota archaeon]|nr:hypothetical protein [Candidatus Woesearchaeota archaeon]